MNETAFATEVLRVLGVDTLDDAMQHIVSVAGTRPLAWIGTDGKLNVATMTVRTARQVVDALDSGMVTWSGKVASRDS